jgi:hypothetical protein
VGNVHSRVQHPVACIIRVTMNTFYATVFFLLIFPYSCLFFLLRHVLVNTRITIRQYKYNSYDNYGDLALQVEGVSRIGTIKYDLESGGTRTRAPLRW